MRKGSGDFSGHLATLATYHFERFTLDPDDRRLRLDGAPVELSARYYDALTLLVREHGKLVSKDRFFAEVWRGVPVTDEALTQCIRTLRRQLGDDAASPRFIETAPKHGYRFIAPVERVETRADRAVAASPTTWRHVLLLGLAGTAGGGVAGAIGGLLYGFAGASQTSVGGISAVLVIFCLTVLIALVGGAGVAFGIAGASFVSPRAGPWSVFGGALGGLVVGAVVKLLGLDAFHLLFGHSPGDITGALEGALLGAGVGLGAWLGERWGTDLRRRLAVAGVVGAATGVFVSLLGGRLMGGSLDLLARSFPESSLTLAPIGALLGETGLGPVSLAATAAVEGFLFGACIVGGMAVAKGFPRMSSASTDQA